MTLFCKYLILLIFLFGISEWNFAQENDFWNDYHSPEEFRYNNETYYKFFFQNSRGFIWGMDQEAYLVRYDGFEIRSFRYEEADSASPSICSLIPQFTEFLEDKKGNIWFTGYSCINRYDPVSGKFDKIHYRLMDLIGNERKLVGGFIDLMEDSNGDIWMGTNLGLFKYELEKQTIKHIEYPKKLGFAQLIFEDNQKRIWTLFRGGNSGYNGVLKWFDKTSGYFTDSIPIPPSNSFIPHKRRDRIAKLDSGKLFLLLINHTVVFFDPISKVMTPVRDFPYSEGNRFCYLYQNDNLILLSNYKNELYQFNPENHSFHLNQSIKPKNNSRGLVNIFQSKEGVIWYHDWDSTKKLKPKKNALQDVIIPGEPDDLDHDHPKEYIMEYKGEVYFITAPKLTPVRKKTISPPPIGLSIPGVEDLSKVYFKFDEDTQGNFWMLAKWAERGPTTLFKILIRKYSEEGEIVEEYSCTHEDADCFPAKGHRLNHLELDENGDLWILMQEGLCRFSPRDQKFVSFPTHKSDKQPPVKVGGVIRFFFTDNEKNIWIASNNPCLMKLNPETGFWDYYPFENVKWDEMGRMVLIVYVDINGIMWVGTSFGLKTFDKSNKRFIPHPGQDLLFSKDVIGIFEDYKKSLWFYTVKEVAKYDPERNLFFPFANKDYKYFSSFAQDKDGFIYLRKDLNTISYFHSDSIVQDKRVPPVIFTDLKLANKLVKPGDSTKVLQKSIDFTENIVLKYKHNDFSILYTAPEYVSADDISFAVQLEGYHYEWRKVGLKREAAFTNLNPGEYTFKVKVRNHHGVWSEVPRVLKIEILPPWYRTWWAYALWITIILGLIYWFYRFQLSRRLAEAEAIRLKELDLAKSQLYTNITHEFRTPLTIILGMADQVKSDPKNWFSEGIKLIRRNGKQLLNLVNQLLDLSKLDSNDMPVTMVNGDIVSFVKYQIESFHSYADSKDIRLHFMSDLEEFHMDHDPEKLQNIISNLLSNAIKFTPSSGDVYFDLRQAINHDNLLKIQIRDNGIGIAPEHLPNIFDRFYQVDATSTRRGEGTGIGLALTRELVLLLNGKIEVESGIGKGTKFTILLPITQKADKTGVKQSESFQHTITETVIIEKKETQTANIDFLKNESIVLLIEDNPDVITYLASFLSGEYTIHTASDGQEGIEKALEITPDLIVSDVMMPKKDGFEVCATLKQDVRTSHIPIILLTAKSDQNAKLEGLSFGADAYLSKPFNKEELLVRIEKLIELRKRLQNHYQSTDDLLKINEKQQITPEDIFLQKIVQIVQENLSDEHFGLPDLCRKAGLSRSQLFRKLKALTGKSTTHFIRSLRLTKGKELLETTDLTVSEIAFEVGFGRPDYFTKTFREEFGISPSEIRKK